MTATQQQKLEAFRAMCDEMRNAGFAVVASVAVHGPHDSYFSARICVEKASDVDHVVLDAIRDISAEWSLQAHK